MRTVHTLALLAVLLAGCSRGIAMGEGREVQATDIAGLINDGRHVDLDSCIVFGDLDFTALKDCNRITGSLRQVYVRSSITFTRCVFTGKVKAFDRERGVCVEFAHNLSFVDCDFRDEVDLSEATVNGNAFFSTSVFRKEARMQGVSFRHRKTYFNDVKFEGEALFQNAVFAGDANFMHSVFDSTASFQKATVGGTASFGNARFNGYADFTHIRAAETVFPNGEWRSENEHCHKYGRDLSRPIPSRHQQTRERGGGEKCLFRHCGLPFSVIADSLFRHCGLVPQPPKQLRFPTRGDCGSSPQ